MAMYRILTPRSVVRCGQTS